MFKLTRMTGLMITEESREQRNVPQYDRDKLNHSEGEVEVTVRFDRSIRWRIIDEFGAERIKYDDNGDIVITFTWSDKMSLLLYVLTFGDKAEILSPTGYRSEYRRLVENIIKKYQNDF